MYMVQVKSALLSESKERVQLHGMRQDQHRAGSR